jgi:ParB family chromosome partitioning protein
MRLYDLAAGRADMFKIDPRTIVVEEGFNGRDFSTADTAAHVEALSISISEKGVLQPLTVRLADDKVLLVDGECRLRATLLSIKNGADIKTVPCISEDRHANDADRIASLITRNSGKPLTILEQAGVYKRLAAFGLKQAEIARKVGVTASQVSHVLDLAGAPQEVQEMVRRGEVSATTATKTIRSDGPEKGAAALRKAVGTAKGAGKKKATPAAVMVARGVSKPLSADQVNELVSALGFIAENSTDEDTRNHATNVLVRVGRPLAGQQAA